MDEIGDAVDVLVLGAGLSGMSAAVQAAVSGASVAVVESAPMIGGSAALSGGYVWALRSTQDLAQEDPGEFQRHGHIVVEGYADTIAWLGTFAGPLTEEVASLGGRGHRFDIPLTVAQMARKLIGLGGRIFVHADVVDIAVNAGSYRFELAGVSEVASISARSVVFASGGRQADPAVRSGLVGGRFVPQLRGNIYSRGGGARVASQLGASLNLKNKGFYGHLYPAGLEALSPADFIMLALYHSSSGVLIDESGARFTDERRGDHINAMALAERGGRGVLMWSEETQQKAVGAGFVPGLAAIDRFAFCRDRGAHVAVAAHPAELAPIITSWGYGEFYPAADSAAILGRGRVYVVEVVPAITFTFGGIEVDDAGAVINDDRQQVPGLFAAGADMSDAYHKGYGGGLSLAVASGRRAGRLAAEHAASGHVATHA
jgi:succinate dehydrogenase/fumarate reductase flavoprotein subunit